jgi:hypothetical protein
MSIKFTRERVRPVIAAIPIMGVNATAFIGQFSFMKTHITSWPIAGIILLSATIESIAVYLAFEAHEAMRKGDSSFTLRMGSYLFGALIGVLNYSHYCGPAFRPTFLAVATALMSTSSAPLWGIYSRRIGRERLIELGLIESRSVKFSRTRWILWPRETFAAFRLSAWTGQQNPDIAIRDYEHARKVKQEIANAEQRETESADEALLRDAEEIETELRNATDNKAERVRIVIRRNPTLDPRGIVAWLEQWGYADISTAYVRQVKSIESRRNAENRHSNVHPLPSASDAR